LHTALGWIQFAVTEVKVPSIAEYPDPQLYTLADAADPVADAIPVAAATSPIAVTAPPSAT